MNERQKLIPLAKLNLTDRFLFKEVMEDPLAHQEALGIIFGTMWSTRRTRRPKAAGATVSAVSTTGSARYGTVKK